MKLFPGIFAAALALISAPAHADWGATRWGDPIDAVIASVGQGIAAKAGTEDNRVFDQDLAAEQVGAFHGLAVRYEFFVDPARRGLSLVRMVPVDEARDCEALAAAVLGEFGKPKLTKREDLFGIIVDRSEWADRQANLAILLSEFSGAIFADRSCLVTWQPHGSGKPGLEN